MRPRSGGHRRRHSAADFRRQRIIGIGWARERIPSLCFFGLGYVRCRDAKNRNGLLGSKRLRRNLDHKGHEGARRRFRGAVERRDCARIGKACKAKALEGFRSHRSPRFRAKDGTARMVTTISVTPILGRSQGTAQSRKAALAASNAMLYFRRHPPLGRFHSFHFWTDLCGERNRA